MNEICPSPGVWLNRGIAMRNKKLLILIGILSSFGIFCMGCAEEKSKDIRKEHRSLADNPDEVWQDLSAKRIFFGHKSVGNNLLDGVRDIMAENPKIHFDIIETNDPADMSADGVLAHYGIGENRNPVSKLKAFSEYLDGGIGNRVDIAFMKFCYVDFSENTDVQALFSAYRETMASLKSKYPGVVFVHFTAPLVSRERGLKPLAKKILGRPVRNGVDNLARSAYNDLVRETYAGEEPVFDLAKAEYTLPDNTQAGFEKSGQRIFELAPRYTDDGGHLNEDGRKIAAERLLLELADIL